MVELDVPAMIHVSASCNPNFHATGAHYINADTTAFMQFIEGNLFKDFPSLRFIIPHGGGAVPYHWGRYRGLADMLKRPPLPQHVMKNVFFDTCVYHQPGIDPETGNYYDDTKRYIDALTIPDADKHRIFEGNARRVFPRLDTILKSRGQ
jgi:4-oxalmesaconate hydratase